jgi:hypothetical protein
MSLSINLASLSSRINRVAITGNTGIRRLATNASRAITDAQTNEPKTFWDGLQRFGASLIGAIRWQPPWLKFSVAGLFSFFNSAVQFLIHFNWNSTDQQLDDEIKQLEIAVASARGALRGTVAGYLVCGVVPAATLAVFNEPLALYALERLGEEAADEIVGNMSALLQATSRKNAKQTFNNIYKNFRGVLRPAALGFANILKGLGILDQASIDKANQQRDQPWSFNSALEDTIDNVKDPLQHAELEEFWDEFGDACIEAGYIVANSIDAYFLQQKVQENAAEEKEHTIIMSPSGAIQTINVTPNSSSNP